jgi:hypothetical protein
LMFNVLLSIDDFLVFYGSTINVWVLELEELLDSNSFLL